MLSKRKATDHLYADSSKRAFTGDNIFSGETSTATFTATSTSSLLDGANEANATVSSSNTSASISAVSANVSISTDSVLYTIPSSGAYLSLFTGLSLLNEYCSTLTIPTTPLFSAAPPRNSSILILNTSAVTSTLSSQPSVLEPQFSFFPVPNKFNNWYVSVLLPDGAPFQSLSSGPHYSKLKAKLHLSVEVCKRLHKLGVLDLQPAPVKSSTKTSHSREDSSALRCHPPLHHYDVINPTEKAIVDDDAATLREINAAMQMFKETELHRSDDQFHVFALFMQARDYLLSFMGSHPPSPSAYPNKASPLDVRFRHLDHGDIVPWGYICDITIWWQSSFTKVESDFYIKQGMAICHAALLLCMKLGLIQGVSLRPISFTGISFCRGLGRAILSLLLAVEAFVTIPGGPGALTKRRVWYSHCIKDIKTRLMQISGGAFNPEEIQPFFLNALIKITSAGGFDLALRVVKDLIGDGVFPQINRWKDLTKAFKKNPISAALYSTTEPGPLSDQDVEEVETTLRYTFKNKAILQKAFILQSHDFERLEFLGDALMGFITVLYWTHYLEGQHPRLSVSNDSFGKILYQLGLCQYISGGKGKRFHQKMARINAEVESDRRLKDMHFDKLFGDVLEALMGAVFVDSDFDIRGCKTVFLDALMPVYV
ncbi:hypothetical protein BX616_001765 [Lobosporangium transversale]|nr:hypothetical protein BX616_001765 [Lobosporangium transversale]